MATTFVDSDGNGVATRTFSFPSIKEADIKVEVDGVIFDNRGISGASAGTQTYTITNYTESGGGTVNFDTNAVPQDTTPDTRIRIFRDTDVDVAKAEFQPGSSIKAGELNSNMTQILYSAQEET